MPHDAVTLSHLTHRAERHGQWTASRPRPCGGVRAQRRARLEPLARGRGLRGLDGEGRGVVGGIAGLVAGSLSMASGEYVSMQANRELLERELEIERREIEADPTGETLELAGIYAERGIDTDAALAMANRMMENPTPRSKRTPGTSWASTRPSSARRSERRLPRSWPSRSARRSRCAVVFVSGTTGVVISLALGILAAAVLGGSVGLLAGRSWVRGALRQVIVVVGAFTATYVIGRAVGAAVT